MGTHPVARATIRDARRNTERNETRDYEGTSRESQAERNEVRDCGDISCGENLKFEDNVTKEIQKKLT